VTAGLAVEPGRTRSSTLTATVRDVPALGPLGELRLRETRLEHLLTVSRALADGHDSRRDGQPSERKRRNDQHDHPNTA
jgi:hypothetical protein